jgi:hypothetical protein
VRPACLVTLLMLFTSPLFAEDAKAPACASLCPKEAQEGFVSLFDGKTLDGWQGDTQGYTVEDGVLVCKKEGGGNLFTKKEYTDFIFRVEYKLQPGGNNGVGIRAPLEGTPGFTAMEIQILDDTAPEYQNLQPFQFNASIYGVAAAERGHMKKVGEWNAMEIQAKGTRIKVTLNGVVVVEADMKTVGPKRIHDHDLTGLCREKGFIAFCGHGHRVDFRNIRIKQL